MRSRNLGKLTTNSSTCRSKPSSLPLTGGASPFCLAVLMAQGLNTPGMGGDKLPIWQKFTFLLYPFPPKSYTRCGSSLFFLCICSFQLKIKKTRKERSYFYVCFCMFLLGSRTVPFTNWRDHLCLRGDFPVAEY